MLSKKFYKNTKKIGRNSVFLQINIGKMEQIKRLANQYFTKTVEIYHHLHQHPELSGKEMETAAYICQILDDYHIDYQSNIAGCGIVAQIHGTLKKGKVVALRADMDALPIQEATGLPFASEVPHVMHACGHDVHVASLLGTIMILNEIRNHFGGVVKAVFQPSEEEYEGGAKFMIEQNVLENPKVDVIIGQHVTPGMETGTVGFKSGPFMASTDEIHLTIKGKGGHAAMPLETINPIYVGTAIIEEMKRIIKEKQPDDTPTILSFGKFVAAGSTNIIPDTAELAGTFRTFNEVWREEVCALLKKTVNKYATEFRANCQLDIRHGYPVLTNDETVTKRVREDAIQILGKERVLNLPIRMTSEDFAYYLLRRPGVFYRLGVSNSEQGITQTTHSPQFRIDEESLRTAITLMSWIAFNELNL